MRGVYSVAFLLPMGAERSLGDDGWEFNSEQRISSQLESVLKGEYLLRTASDECSYFEGENISIEVFKDRNGLVENVYFRFYGGVPPSLPVCLRDADFIKKTEFFVPCPVKPAKGPQAGVA